MSNEQTNTDHRVVHGDALRVTTADGKYTVVLTNSGTLYALRYGQWWRECLGDNLVLSLAQTVETLGERVKELSPKNT